MASQTHTNGQLTALHEQLTKEPHRFDFYQAMRLLRVISLVNGQEREPIGEYHNPHEEIVRFRALPSLRFPASPITSIAALDRDTEAPRETRQMEMVVTFMGLTGPLGVLPRHYTQLLINRIREKDFALRDFLDLFNHRIISLFYRAWEKYQFPIVYESTALQESEQRGQDLFTRCLYGVTGFGIKELRNRLEVSDEAFLYYGGLFGRRLPTAVSLVGMLEDYLGLPTRVMQFQGQWLYLSKPNQSSLPSAQQSDRRNNQLGRNLVIGRRVWDVQSKFRLRIGPLTYSQFRRFMPDGDQLVRLCQLVRSYVGPGYDFDVMPVLRLSEVPRCRLGDQSHRPPRLGWNTWLCSSRLAHDAEDAVFAHEGTPSR